MTNVERGSTYPWPAYVRNAQLQLADPDTLVVEVRDSGAVLQPGFPISLAALEIEHDGVGQFHFDWVIPSTQALGTYTSYWTGMLDGDLVSGEDSINVVSEGSLTAVDGPLLSYLTPERLRALPLAANLTGWSDLELAELIAEASGEVHAYCNVPLEGQFSFLGGTVTEEHTWRLPDNPYDPGQTRIYPRVHDIISIDSVQLQLSANTFQTVPVSTFVVNNVEGWLELSALVLSPGIFGISFFIFPLAALERPKVIVGLTYGRTFQRLGERLYPIADGSRTYQAPDGFWTNDVATLAGAGAAVDPDDYVIDRASGQVTFDEDADLPASPVTANYVTRLERSIAQATAKICEHIATRARGSSKLLVGGLTSVKVGEISMSRNVPGRSLSSGSVIEDLAHDVPAAARMLDGYRFITLR